MLGTCADRIRTALVVLIEEEALAVPLGGQARRRRTQDQAVALQLQLGHDGACEARSVVVDAAVPKTPVEFFAGRQAAQVFARFEAASPRDRCAPARVAATKPLTPPPMTSTRPFTRHPRPGWPWPPTHRKRP